MSKKQILLALTLMVSLPSTTTLAGESVATFFKGPAFMAQMKVSNKSNPHMASRSDVWVSKHGMRIVAYVPGDKTMVTLVREKDTVMLFPDRHQYINTAEAEQAAGQVVDKGPFSLLANEPCQGYARSKKMESTRLGGRKVTKWSCGDTTGIGDTVQFYDADLQRVIKSQTPDGTVMELRDIKVKQSIAKKLFEVPANYEKMSLSQLIQPSGISLAPFVEEAK
jgi:outer membrane lipoprotein-sorting protein